MKKYTHFDIDAALKSSGMGDRDRQIVMNLIPEPSDVSKVIKSMKQMGFHFYAKKVKAILSEEITAMEVLIEKKKKRKKRVKDLSNEYWPADLYKFWKLMKGSRLYVMLAPFYGRGAGYRSGATQPPGQVIGTTQPASPSTSPAYPGAGGINAPGVPGGPGIPNSGMGSSYEGEAPALSEDKAYEWLSGALTEENLDDLEDVLDQFVLRFKRINDNYKEYDLELDPKSFIDAMMEFARDPEDDVAKDNAYEWSEGLGDVIDDGEEEGKAWGLDLKKLHDDIDKLVTRIDRGDYSDEDENEEDTAEVDGHVYTNKDVVKFVHDMEKHGLDVEHYRGRFYWEGPAVRTDEGPQEIQRMTRVKIQWDQLGLGHIVYPVKSDKGIKK